MNGMATAALAQYGSDQGISMEARRNANALFSNAMNRGKLIMILQKLFGKQNNLRAFATVDRKDKPVQKQNKMIVNVPIEKIVGSEGRAQDFDKQFRPLVNHIRDRWIGVAIAYRRGKALPPVELIQVGDEYYVRDGHHRISVAKLFGQATIEAKIIYEVA